MMMPSITDVSVLQFFCLAVFICTPTRVAATSSSSSSSARNLVLAIDGGTESIRAACINVATGAIVGQTTHVHAYPTRHPHPGWAEQDPDDWWHALGTAVRNLVADLGEDDATNCIRAMSLDTTCCSVVALDGQQRPVRPCILWMDQRAAGEAAEVIAKGQDDPALAVNNDGHGPVSAEWMLPKALWMQRHWPELWRNEIVSVCEYQDYLNLRLTGVLCASACNAATRWHWDGNAALDSTTTEEYPGRPLSLYKSLGIPELAERLPQTVLPMGAPVGSLTEEAAAHLDLPVGLPVIQGGPDAFVGMIGLGCVQAGKQLCLITGSSHLHCVVAKTGNTAKGIWGAYPGAPLPGLFFAEGGQSSTGSILRWARRELFGDALSYAALDAEAATIAPGADGLIALETFQGSRTPVTDAKARGSLIGLTLSHTRAHIWRSFLEAVCYGTRACVEALEDAGHAYQEIVLAGGVTRSALWLQMHADVTNKVVTVCANSENAPLLGCAVLAAVGVGLYPSVPAACAAMVHTERTVPPNPAMAAQYDQVYNTVYRKVAPAVQPISHAIHTLRGGGDDRSGAAAILHRSSTETKRRTVVVSPSLLACDWGNMRQEVHRCMDANLRRLHVDVFDGVFLDSPLALTFGPAMVEVICQSAADDAGAIKIDLHVCVDRPGRYIAPMARAGASTFIFQWEAVPRLEDATALARQVLDAGMECGVSLNPSTPIDDAIFQLLQTNTISIVNLLAVEPGFGGQAYQYRVTEKIQQLAQWRSDHQAHGAKFKIMVDGGINGATAGVATDAGADILVAGSYLFRSNDLSAASAKLLGESRHRSR